MSSPTAPRIFDPAIHVPLAEAVARAIHEGQFRRDNKTPYIQHVEDVVHLVDTPVEQTVAWLHDTLETGKLTAQDLYRHGFPATIISKVLMLTLNSKLVETYDGYIRRLSTDPVCRVVKMADIVANVTDQPTEFQKAKYTAAMKVLTDAHDSDSGIATSTSKRFAQVCNIPTT